jgi:hypothetical protein
VTTRDTPEAIVNNEKIMEFVIVLVITILLLKIIPVNKKIHGLKVIDNP